MAIYKVQTGLRLEESMQIKITHIAKTQRRSLNSQIEFLIQQCIDEYESKNGVIPLVIDNN